jgi:hypothetical protein
MQNIFMKKVFSYLAGGMTLLSLVVNLGVSPVQAYTTHWVYEAENMPGVGAANYSYGNGVKEAVAGVTAAGYMVYGPYSTDQLPTKKYRATFNLRYQGSSSTTNPLVQLEVYNVGGNILNDRKLYASDFASAGQFSNFSLDFTRPQTSSMEYRVYFYGERTIDVDSITVDEIAPTDDITYESENMRRKVGSVISDPTASGGQAVLALASQGAGHMQYGPYSVDQDVNNTFKATFRLKVSDNSSSAVIARIDAANAWGTGEWTKRDLKGTDFTAPNTWQDFSFNFDRINEGSMEYRVEVYGITNIYADYVRVQKATQTNNSYESENLMSAVGTIVSDSAASSGQARQATSDQVGYLQYGPYTVDQAAGQTYSAYFTLSVSDHTQHTPVARIEAFNSNGNGDWRFKIVYANDFTAPNKYETFPVDFTRTSSGTMEFRVYTLGNPSGITLRADKVDVYKNNTTNWVYQAENSLGAVGNVGFDVNASGQRTREATVTADPAGYVVYGPYVDEQPVGGVYTAHYYLKTSNNTTGSNVARIDVNNPGGSSVYVFRDVKGTDFSAANTWQDFTLNFNRQSGGNLEFRVWFADVADLAVDRVEVQPLTQTTFVYQAENLSTKSGVGSVVSDSQADGSKAVKAPGGNSVCSVFPDYCYVVFGPYTVDQATGNYQVTYRLKKGSSSSPSSVARVEALNDDGSGTFVVKDVKGYELSNTDYTDITLNYYRTGAGTMEYRVYSYNLTDIYVDKITVTKI